MCLVVLVADWPSDGLRGRTVGVGDGCHQEGNGCAELHGRLVKTYSIVVCFQLNTELLLRCAYCDAVI